MRLVVVTGAAGFVGSVLASALAVQGRAVVAVDRLDGDERYHNLAPVQVADYWDADSFLALLASPRRCPPLAAVVHLGACSSTTETDAGYLMRNNFAYTRELAVHCLRRGVRFIYASSAATYGDGEQGFRDGLADLPRLLPRNKYAFSKHAFDLWALSHGAFDGSNAITGLKYFNLFGPNEYHKGDMRSMVLKAWEQVRGCGVVKLFRSHRPDFADGEQRRDFLYVKDAVDMTAWFLDHPAATGIFNIGSGVERTWNDLAHAVFVACGKAPRIEYREMPAEIRASYQYSTRADLARLRTAGCTVPARSLEEGINDYVCQYLEPHSIRPS